FMLDREGGDVRSSLSFYEMYKAPNSFLEVWRVAEETEGDLSLITHGTDCTNPAFPSEPVWLHNLTPAERAAGEAACAGIVDETAREPCILDVGLTGDPILATSAQDVITQLANQGVVAPPLPTPRVVYFNNFGGSLGNEWDTVVTSVTPLGDRTFLGTFGNENVRLTLNNLSLHSQIIVSFDLFLINGWDGDGPFGPNTWKASVDGVEAVSYTFSNTFSTQSYPFPGSNPGTGALEQNSLFYPFGDSVYRVTLTVPHTGSTLDLDLAAEGLSGLFNEAWGVGNFEVQGTRAPALAGVSTMTTVTRGSKSHPVSFKR
ncbi:MAG TPA: hypothetical protein PKU97_21640, partial [Kofleriaceae bacterium]|nr:hypothetical protein [Kofleriaceae bacterium]